MAAVAAIVVVLDLVTKRVVTSALGPDADDHAWWLVGDDIGFEYVRNTGAAFGVFRGNAELLAAISIVVSIALAGLVIVELGGGRYSALAGGLIVGGALGNVVERAIDGFVTDFVAVGPWPRFNVADSAITIGVALFIVGVALLVDDRGAARRVNSRREVQRDRSA
jgi:signal peptidase II